MNSWDLALIAGVIAGYAAIQRTLPTTPLHGPDRLRRWAVLGDSGLDWIHLGGDSDR